MNDDDFFADREYLKYTRYRCWVVPVEVDPTLPEQADRPTFEDGDAWDVCPACDGTGQDWDLTPCAKCDGEGFISF